MGMGQTTYDVAVIGAGIVGLAHAWMASRRGLRVVLLERTGVAEGASVRNFGMFWPVGQPAGVLHDTAMRSRALWLELGQAGVVQAQACGSLHLAHHDDELAVLEEFTALGTHNVQMLTPEEVTRRAPLANPHGLLGGMWSDTEMRVNPRVASAQIARFLHEQCSVECCFRTSIIEIEEQAEQKILRSSNGQQWTARRVVVCSGSDLQTLYPQEFSASGLKLCKLQMMKSVAQPESLRQEVHLASGLTLRHYTSFQACPSLAKVKARVSEEMPELDRYGIHVMASPFPNGEVILGDSHEYDSEISPFDKTLIDELMLRECQKVFHLHDWTMVERWYGIYSKHSQLPIFETEARPGVHLFVGPGGAGMTMSFGLADRAWQRWMGEN